MDLAEPVNRLIEQFKKLPGIGAKSAQRLAFFVLKMEQTDATELAESILEVKRSIRRCSVCNNLTDVDPCHFCTHAARSDGDSNFDSCGAYSQSKADLAHCSSSHKGS